MWCQGTTVSSRHGTRSAVASTVLIVLWNLTSTAYAIFRVSSLSTAVNLMWIAFVRTGRRSIITSTFPWRFTSSTMNAALPFSADWLCRFICNEQYLKHCLISSDEATYIVVLPIFDEPQRPDAWRHRYRGCWTIVVRMVATSRLNDQRLTSSRSRISLEAHWWSPFPLRDVSKYSPYSSRWIQNWYWKNS